MFMAETLISRGDYDEAELEIRADSTRRRRIVAGNRARSRSCGCVLCWLERAATTPPIGNCETEYRAMANNLGYEGHMKWAAEMA